MRLDIATVENFVAHSLPLSDWGFFESAKTNLYVIYNSQWCRIKFLIDKDRNEDYLHIYYGRLHAPDSTWRMEWGGKSCYCWHWDFREVLEFLDGASPQTAYEQRYTPFQFYEDFYNSKFEKSSESFLEKQIKLHSAIWDYYGIRFFELFDLRHPNLWEKYIKYLKEYYKLHEEQIDAAYKLNGITRDPEYPPQYQKC